jgi:hypothetical protein
VIQHTGVDGTDDAFEVEVEIPSISCRTDCPCHHLLGHVLRDAQGPFIEIRMMRKHKQQSGERHLNSIYSFVVGHVLAGSHAGRDDLLRLKMSSSPILQAEHKLTIAGLSFSGSVAIMAGIMFHLGNIR